MSVLDDTITVGEVVRLVGAVDVHAVVVERTARALVVRWHAHYYRAEGAAAGPAERARRGVDGGAPVWSTHAFDAWVPPTRERRRRAKGAPRA